jgi:hypothetical protein
MLRHDRSQRIIYYRKYAFSSASLVETREGVKQTLFTNWLEEEIKEGKGEGERERKRKAKRK